MVDGNQDSPVYAKISTLNFPMIYVDLPKNWTNGVQCLGSVTLVVFHGSERGVTEYVDAIRHEEECSDLSMYTLFVYNVGISTNNFSMNQTVVAILTISPIQVSLIWVPYKHHRPFTVHLFTLHSFCQGVSQSTYLSVIPMQRVVPCMPLGCS